MIKNRVEFAKYLGDLGLKKGAEIGVCDGHFSVMLLDTIPGLELYCIDPWLGYGTYREKGFSGHFRNSYEKAMDALSGRARIIRKLSMDALADIPDESLDFVFIDGNHSYDYVREDVREWTKKVRKGGIVSGHDYYVMRSGGDDVIRAVNEYVAEHGYQLQVTGWDKETHIDHDDRHPCWFFVK